MDQDFHRSHFYTLPLPDSKPVTRSPPATNNCGSACPAAHLPGAGQRRDDRNACCRGFSWVESAPFGGSPGHRKKAALGARQRPLRPTVVIPVGHLRTPPTRCRFVGIARPQAPGPAGPTASRTAQPSKAASNRQAVQSLPKGTTTSIRLPDSPPAPLNPAAPVVTLTTLSFSRREVGPTQPNSVAAQSASAGGFWGIFFGNGRRPKIPNGGILVATVSATTPRHVIRRATATATASSAMAAMVTAVATAAAQECGAGRRRRHRSSRWQRRQRRARRDPRRERRQRQRRRGATTAGRDGGNGGKRRQRRRSSWGSGGNGGNSGSGARATPGNRAGVAATAATAPPAGWLYGNGGNAGTGGNGGSRRRRGRVCDSQAVRNPDVGATWRRRRLCRRRGRPGGCRRGAGCDRNNRPKRWRRRQWPVGARRVRTLSGRRRRHWRCRWLRQWRRAAQAGRGIADEDAQGGAGGRGGTGGASAAGGAGGPGGPPLVQGSG